jgi:aminoglycoside phosphotransferase (APT) family kinase protein
VKKNGIISYVTDHALEEATALRASASERRRQAEEEDQLAETLEELHQVATRHAPATTIGLVSEQAA